MLHPGRNNPLQIRSLQTDWLGISSGDSGLWQQARKQHLRLGQQHHLQEMGRGCPILATSQLCAPSTGLVLMAGASSPGSSRGWASGAHPARAGQPWGHLTSIITCGKGPGGSQDLQGRTWPEHKAGQVWAVSTGAQVGCEEASGSMRLPGRGVGLGRICPWGVQEESPEQLGLVLQLAWL